MPQTNDTKNIDTKKYKINDELLNAALLQVGKKITEEREKQNYTIADISLMTNLDTAHLYRIEKGERIIGLKALLKIAFCLNRPISDFLPLEFQYLSPAQRFELAISGASPEIINELMQMIEIYVKYQKN